MKKFIFNKLVRDKIPALLEKTGSTIHTKTLSDAEYKIALMDKLFEEANEVKSATGKQDITQEIADVYEVIDALCALYGIYHVDIQQCKKDTLSSRGRFYHRTYVTIAEHQPHSVGEKYCLDNPSQYPETRD